VISIVPEADKHFVFEESYRILKAGGRLAVSDILARKPCPPELESNLALYAGCMADASLVEEYEKYWKDAGFEGMYASLNRASNHGILVIFFIRYNN
jgi:arsenite methyltransferase